MYDVWMMMWILNYKEISILSTHELLIAVRYMVLIDVQNVCPEWGKSKNFSIIDIRTKKSVIGGKFSFIYRIYYLNSIKGNYCWKYLFGLFFPKSFAWKKSRVCVSTNSINSVWSHFSYNYITNETAINWLALDILFCSFGYSFGFPQKQTTFAVWHRKCATL